MFKYAAVCRNKNVWLNLKICFILVKLKHYYFFLLNTPNLNIFFPLLVSLGSNIEANISSGKQILWNTNICIIISPQYTKPFERFLIIFLKHVETENLKVLLTNLVKWQLIKSCMMTTENTLHHKKIYIYRSP